MADAERDENGVPTLLGVLSTDGRSLVRVKVNSSNKALSVDNSSAGSDNGPAISPRDGNFIPALIAVSSVDGVTPVVVYADASGKLLIDSN